MYRETRCKSNASYRAHYWEKLMLFNLFFLFGCGEKEISNEDPNIAPDILITSHDNPIEVIAFYPETFIAVATDEDNAPSDLMVSWQVDGQTICDWQVVNPQGESLCDIPFAVGAQQLTAKVRDLDQALGETSLPLAVSPNSSPEFQIQAPQNGQHFYLDQLIDFRAWVNDEESDAATISSSWTSSLDGQLTLNTTPDENGNISDERYLSEGQHAITFEAEDETGLSASQEIVITVNPANTAPECVILEPVDGELSLLGDPVILSGSVIDQEVESSDITAIWSSSRDGILDTQTPEADGQVRLELDSLTTGLHYITLTGTDEMGKNCTSSLTILVDTHPSAVIDYPATETVFSIGETISFQGTTLDGEDLEYVLAVEWSSSQDGVLETDTASPQGTSFFSRDDLTPGAHDITFTATDSAGLSASDSISLYINTPPEAPNVVLSPDPVFANLELEAQASGSSDIDDDVITYSYAWWVDGVAHSSAASIIPASELHSGETWLVRVTPNDGYTDGAYTEASITISNSPPSFTAPASISPSIAYMNDVLSCSAVVEDIDDGALSVIYEWSNENDDILSSTDSYQISSSDVSVHETITCTASSVDSEGESISSVATITLSNTAPIVETPVISSPAGAFFIDSILECSASALDPDQSLTPEYHWERDGIILETTDSIDLSLHSISAGDEILCVATATDDEGEIASAAAAAIICYATDCDQNLRLDVNTGIGLDMKRIPAGTFWMGSPTTEMGRGTDETQVEVTLTQDYLMTTTEITQEAYEAIDQTIWSESQTPMMGVSESHPVYYVSWHMAASYANALTLHHNLTHNTTLTSCYSCQNGGTPSAICSSISNPYQCTGYRLPTEAEWEYAARGGSTASFWTEAGDEDIPVSNIGDCASWSFLGGETLENYAWFCANNDVDETKQTAEKTPNSYGLYDMHGNVAEWCHDWYQYYYPIGSITDPVQLIPTSDRVLRGGNWTDNPEVIRAAARDSSVPTYRFPTIGFRIIRSVD